MKRWIAFVLCGAMTFSFAACSGAQNQKEISDTPANLTVSENAQQIPSPFIECKTIEEAESMAGFSFSKLEKLPKGYEQDEISAIKDNMIQVLYRNGENKILMRKSKGSGDNSGRYDVFEESKKETVHDTTVELKGNNGTVSVAVWESGEFSYSVSVMEEGIDSAEMMLMIENIDF